MDINQITDVNQLKAMAFDAIRAIEVNQQNLRILQQRIEELSASQAATQESGAKTKK